MSLYKLILLSNMLITNHFSKVSCPIINLKRMVYNVNGVCKVHNNTYH
jgi:hypothetical protein